MFKKENNKKIIVYILIGIVVVIASIKLIDIYYQNNNNEEITIQNVLTTEDEPEKIENEIIKVYVTGEVKNQGVIELEQGSRIVDAIEKAGGQTEEANLKNVNLAYELEDGQKIYIPNKKDKVNKEEYIVSNSGENVMVEEGKNTGNNNTNNIKDGKSTNVKGVISKVNINLASQSDLETLPGIGPSLAQRILEYRKENGKFQKIEDIQNVKGIGDAKYNKIKDYLSIWYDDII